MYEIMKQEIHSSLFRPILNTHPMKSSDTTIQLKSTSVVYFLEVFHTCTQLQARICVAYVYVVRQSSIYYPFRALTYTHMYYEKCTL